MDGQIRDLFKQAQSRDNVTYFVEEFSFAEEGKTLRLLDSTPEREVFPLEIQWPLSIDLTDLSKADLDQILFLSENHYGAKFFKSKEVFLDVLVDMKETLSPFGKIILLLDQREGRKRIFLMRSFGPNSTDLTLDQFRDYSEIFLRYPLATGYKLSALSLAEWFAEKYNVDIGEFGVQKEK